MHRLYTVLTKTEHPDFMPLHPNVEDEFSEA